MDAQIRSYATLVMERQHRFEAVQDQLEWALDFVYKARASYDAAEAVAQRLAHKDCPVAPQNLMSVVSQDKWIQKAINWWLEQQAAKPAPTPKSTHVQQGNWQGLEGKDNLTMTREQMIKRKLRDPRSYALVDQAEAECGAGLANVAKRIAFYAGGR